MTARPLRLALAFRLLNPRKGTETLRSLLRCKHHLLSTYLIPARGLKPNYSNPVTNTLTQAN